jgi:hypothetical protein
MFRHRVHTILRRRYPYILKTWIDHRFNVMDHRFVKKIQKGIQKLENLSLHSHHDESIKPI